MKKPAAMVLGALALSLALASCDMLTTMTGVASEGRRYGVTYASARTINKGSLPVDGKAYAVGDKVRLLPNSGSAWNYDYVWNGWTVQGDKTYKVYRAGDEIRMGEPGMTILANWSYVIENITADPVHYMIGGTGPGGGIIVYQSPYTAWGWEYLEAAPVSTQTSMKWGANGFLDFSIADAEPSLWEKWDYGDGAWDSDQIVAKQDAAGTAGWYAAKYCRSLTAGGKTDWYLPDVYELQAIACNFPPGTADIAGTGFVANADYWTSNEFAENMAWFVNFNTKVNSNADVVSKDKSFYVRAIRKVGLYER